MTLGQTLAVACIAAVSFAFALDAHQQRWHRSREVKALYGLAAVFGAAGLADWLVSVGAWRLLAALCVLASFAAIAVGLAAITITERDQ